MATYHNDGPRKMVTLNRFEVIVIQNYYRMKTGE